MAAFSYDDYGASEEGGTFAALVNWGGAILSLVLIAGLATWGWKLWVRDVSGVPVVRALEGPMRVAPTEPGGQASQYQGLTVNRIAESRVEETPSEQVVLAPQPTTLNEEEDLAMAELPAVAPEPSEEFQVVDVPPVPQIGEPERFEVAEPPAPEAPPLAIGEENSDTPVIASTVAEPEEAPSATDMAVAAALAESGLRPDPAVMKVEAAAHVPKVTPRPIVRPSNLQTVSLQAAPVIRNGEVDPASIAAGTRLVQLGAYESPDIARAEWATVETRSGDYMAGKSRVIQEVNSGGREFYRLRVLGFDQLADARRFCAVLVTEGANCIPVLHD